MAVLTTLNITEKNDNNSLSVTVKVNITQKGVLTTTLSKEDVDKIRSYGIKLPTNRLGNEGYFNSTSFSDLVSQIRKVLKRCLSYKIVEEVPVIKYQLETLCSFAYDKNGNIVPNPSVEWTGNYENGEWRDGTSRLDALFKAGAEWRINSVWHDAREKPDKGKLLIVEDIDSAYDLVYFLTKSKPWEELSEKNHYMRWAYIEDLLPCKEEEGGGDNE